MGGRRVVNPLTAAVSQARDAAGEPYTVVLLTDDRRRAVLDLSWSDGYCCVSRFDAAGRRGDGAYPTWIGRDQTGAVACFVADMLLFSTPDEDGED